MAEDQNIGSADILLVRRLRDRAFEMKSIIDRKKLLTTIFKFYYYKHFFFVIHYV